VVRQARLSDAAKFEGEGFYLFSESLTSPQSNGNDIFLPGAVVAVFATTFADIVVATTATTAPGAVFPLGL